MNEYATKFGRDVLGFVAGIVVIPIMVVFIPIFCAWYLCHENED